MRSSSFFKIHSFIYTFSQPIIPIARMTASLRELVKNTDSQDSCFWTAKHRCMVRPGQGPQLHSPHWALSRGGFPTPGQRTNQVRKLRKIKNKKKKNTWEILKVH